jgi:hypothetical protein
MIEKNIHNISILQNEVKNIYNHESIEVEYMSCNANKTCHVSKIIKTLGFMKNEKKISTHSKL